MTNLKQWWRGKSAHKKQNWFLLALAFCLLAGGFVEYYSWMAGIGALPGFVLVWLEAAR